LGFPLGAGDVVVVVVVVGGGAELTLDEEVVGAELALDPAVGAPASRSAPPHADINPASAPASTKEAIGRCGTWLTLPHPVRD
jgi:hypothetical protein